MELKKAELSWKNMDHDSEYGKLLESSNFDLHLGDLESILDDTSRYN